MIYSIKIKKEYDKNYQKDMYYAELINNEGKVDKISLRKFNTPEEAKKDGERLIDELNKNKVGLSSSKARKWLSLSYRDSYWKYSSFFVIIWFVVFISSIFIFDGFNAVFHIPLIIALFIGILLINIITYKYKYSFIFDNYNLYAFNIPNTKSIGATGLPILDGIQNYEHFKAEMMLDKINNFIEKVSDIERIEKKSEIWLISNITDFKKINDSKYEINCVVRKYLSDKTKVKKFYINDTINDYKLLLETIEYVRHRMGY